MRKYLGTMKRAAYPYERHDSTHQFYGTPTSAPFIVVCWSSVDDHVRTVACANADDVIICINECNRLGEAWEIYSETDVSEIEKLVAACVH